MPVSVVAGTADRVFAKENFPQARHQEHLKAQESFGAHVGATYLKPAPTQ
jgi:hypothetical protein